jgi:hypothetical protein
MSSLQVIRPGVAPVIINQGAGLPSLRRTSPSGTTSQKHNCSESLKLLVRGLLVKAFHRIFV